MSQVGMLDELADELLRRRKRTRAELLGRFRRPAVPIRRSLVQQGPLGRPLPGALAGLVARHDQLALDLLLIAHAIAAAEPYEANQAAAVWARAVGSVAYEPSLSAVSKAWRRLERMRLVRVTRRGRRAVITVLREDGSGQPYDHPGRPSDREAYFKLDLEYWTAGYVEKLHLAGKAVLLILLSLKDWSSVPAERARRWYGISADSFERGLAELRTHELLLSSRSRVEAPLSPTFYTIQQRHRLLPPFRPSLSASELLMVGADYQRPEVQEGGSSNHQIRIEASV